MRRKKGSSENEEVIPVGSFGALVYTKIQPEICLCRCFALCSPASLLAAAVSAIPPASCRDENLFHPKQQVIRLSNRLLVCLPAPGVWIQQDPGVSPVSSRVKSTLGSLYPSLNTRSVATA